MRLPDNLDSDIPKYERYPAGPTLIARKRGRYPGQLDIAVHFHSLCGFRLQDRIGVIADKLIEVGSAVAPHSVRHGTGPATGGSNPQQDTCAHMPDKSEVDAVPWLVC